MILRCHLPRLVSRSASARCLNSNFGRIWVSRLSNTSFRTIASKPENDISPTEWNELDPAKEVEEDDVSFLEKYKRSYICPAPTVQPTNHFSTRHIDKEITLHGHLGTRRDISGNLFFVPLVGPSRDYEIQIVSRIQNKANPSIAHKRLKKLRAGSAVSITGLLKWNLKVSKDIEKTAYSLGYAFSKHLELVMKHAVCLNEFPDDIIVSDGVQFPPEKRHLQIRHDLQLFDRLRLRSEVVGAFRKELTRNRFHEFETPILFKSTPEGAREFLVPTRKPGLAYALPQSPQQYKQILMASGIGRYFQFAKCFRDEDLRADRQPEFTQLDLEMAFANGETVMKTVETLIRDIRRPHSPQPYFLDAGESFPRMTYQQAMDKYGSDKPDTRNKHLIHRIETIIPSSLAGMLTDLQNPIVEVVRLPISDNPDTTRDFVKDFMNSPAGKTAQNNPDGAPGIFIYDSSKPLQALNAFGFEGAEQLAEMYENLNEELQDGDLLIVQARPNVPHSGGSTALGRLRLSMREAASPLELMGPLPKKHEFLWIVDFPMFMPNDGIDPGQGGSSGFKATHHPFTAPRTPRDVDMLATNPLAARADHYDLVVNGVELGGGSRRIHHAEMQKFIMKDILKMSEERMADFSHLFEALRAGCPPHAGFALGFDRLIAVLAWTDSVRDVIAFPKNNKGEDPMAGSPSETTPEQQATYHLQSI